MDNTGNDFREIGVGEVSENAVFLIERNNNHGEKEIQELCVFCGYPVQPSDVTLTKKGCTTINTASILLKDEIKVTVGQIVHAHCRRNYYKEGQKALKSASSHTMPQIPLTECRDNICFFCGLPAIASHKANSGKEIFQVKTTNFQETIQKHIEERQDEWASDVKKRIGNLNLCDSKAHYHQKCNVGFRQKSTNASVGRPQDESRQRAFLKVVDFMNEHEGDAFTINDLIEVMKRGNVEEYCGKFLKMKLIEHFGENICFLQTKGKPDYIIFRHSANSIISEFRKKKSRSAEDEKNEVLEAAGKLILSDISSTNYNKEEYPTADAISKIENNLEFLPESLLIVLKAIIKTKNRDLKIASIGHAIVQAACPRRVIAPLQIGLSVLLHHLTGSKFIIQTLNSFGFCSSYDEVQRFELCASVAEENDLDESMLSKQMVKFVGDNIDHDTRTINGKNTFHAMGMIAAHTPAVVESRVIKRTKPTIEDVRLRKSVQIYQYLGEAEDKNIFYGDISSLVHIQVLKKVDALVDVTWDFQSERPLWSGLMQSVNTGVHPGKSSITILPIIDLNPSDLDCVYSTLLFLAREAEKYQTVATVTFDQPLWWKAYLIIRNEPEESPLKKIILLLGGFHTQMSFLGTIGKLCEGLGLQEVLETVYASNSVPHILSGKAYSRAMRGYFMVDLALNHLFMEELVPQKMSKSEWMEKMSEAERLFDDLTSKRVSLSEIESNTLLDSILEERTMFKESLSSKNRTAKFWLQFMEMVNTFKSNIRAERTGDWGLHLGSLRKMLPYYPSAGHNSYTKCVYIYLQEMARLEKSHPDIYRKFTDGHFIIRRSDRYWAGLSCDLTIEQVLMKNIKSQIGLTRGRGIGDNQRLIWINSMAECVNIKTGIQELTGRHYETSEQHKEVGGSRQKRDLQDSQIILNYLKERNPFKMDEGSALRNIYNGMEANATVNVDEANRIGEKIIASMKDENVADYTFKKKNQAITMHSRNTIVVDGEAVTIDPQLLFQRLILLVGSMDESELRDVFKYELAHRPSSIFDDHGLMRSGDSTSLDNALLKEVGVEETMKMCAFSGKHILSGDYLIRKIGWKRNVTYDDILNDHLSYVQQFKNPIIVFGTYTSAESILDHFSSRKSKGASGVKIAFTGSMPCNSKKESFLINTSNKQRFTDMLSGKLVESGYTILKANNNLNVMIAGTVMQCATKSDTIVTSDDSELLYLLCSHFKIGLKNVYFKYDGKGTKKQSLWNIGKIETAISKNVMSHLPFVNAITGCKTTSHLFGIGKGTAFKKLLKSKDFQSAAIVFSNPNSTTSEIIEAGNRAIVQLYNGKSGQTLNELRYARFAEKVSSSRSCIEVQTLPLTESAAYYHLLRVYLQTQIWLGNENLDVEMYGWKNVDHKLVPRTTDLAIAPQNLLSSIKCGCKGDCATNRCSCKRNKLPCSVACTECRGICCLNPSKVPDDVDDQIE